MKNFPGLRNASGWFAPVGALYKADVRNLRSGSGSKVISTQSFVRENNALKQSAENRKSDGTGKEFTLGFCGNYFDDAFIKETFRNFCHPCSSSLHVFRRKLEFTRDMDCFKEIDFWWTSNRQLS